MSESHLLRPPARRCSARSKATGQPCRSWAIPGGTVCHYHGGKAPQTLAAARERLAALVDPAITRLGELVKENRQKGVALGAVRDVLDRNDLGAVARSEVTGPNGGPLQIMQIQRLIIDGLSVRSTEDG